MDSGFEKGKGPYVSTELVTGLVLSSLTFLVATFIPLIGSVAIIFTPLPILYYYTKLGRIRGIAILFLSLAVTFVALDMVDAESNFFIFLFTGLTGITLAELLKKGYPIEKAIIYPVIILLMAGGVLLLYLSFSLQEAPQHLIQVYVQKNIHENIRLYKQLDLSSDQLELIKDRIPEITSLFTGIFPAFITIIAVTMVWLNTLVAQAVFRARQLPCPDFGDLSYWKVPEKLIWFIIAAGGGILIPVPWIRWPALNILMICLFTYLLQGLAIVSFFFKRKNVPRFFRMFFYFLVFAQFYVILFVSVMGLFDLWFDFRKFVKVKDSTA